MTNKNIYSLLAILISIFIVNNTIYAGPNKQSACYLDMDITTRAYNNLDAFDIESSIIGYAGDNIIIGVLVQNVSNMDTFQVEVSYDPSLLSFVAAAEDMPMKGIKNILKSNGGTTLGFQATEKNVGTINITNTLTGNDPSIAPEGTGLVALLKFKVLSGKSVSLEMKNVIFVDSAQSEDHISLLHGGKIN